MGATPSSAVQQTAYLEALDEFIDYDEDGNLRKCLQDEHGNQLRDSDFIDYDEDGNLRKCLQDEITRESVEGQRRQSQIFD